jgi:hypothetical protein
VSCCTLQGRTSVDELAVLDEVVDLGVDADELLGLLGMEVLPEGQEVVHVDQEVVGADRVDHVEDVGPGKSGSDLDFALFLIGGQIGDHHLVCFEVLQEALDG